VKELRARVSKEKSELSLEGVDAITCKEKLGGEVDFSGRCVLRLSKLEEEK
jgi:hypothetical protein